jgi:hypothetical protein
MNLPLRQRLDKARARAEGIPCRMIALQEELDWRCYRLYGLLDRIEALLSGRIGPAMAGVQAPEPKVTTTVRLADRLHDDIELMELAAVYRGRVDFDLPALVAELVESQSVPFLPVLSYKESGLRKRAQ